MNLSIVIVIKLTKINILVLKWVYTYEYITPISDSNMTTVSF